MKKLPTIVSAAVFASIGTAGSAQDETRLGFPIGDKSRIHTNMDLGVAFDSNAARASSATEISDWRGLIRPGVEVEVPGSSVQFQLGAYASINQFFQTGNQTAFDTEVGGDGVLSLRVGGPDSHVAFRVHDTLVRTPAYVPRPGSISSDEQRLLNWFNQGTAAFIFRPGGGAFELELGYTNQLNFSDDLPDSQQHGGLLEARWKFLPKTAFVFHTDFSVFDAYNEQGDNRTRKSSPLNVTVGLVGQVTRRLSANVAVGYGDTLTWDGGIFSTEASDNTRTVVGRAEIKYEFRRNVAVTAGYERRTLPVIQLNNYISDMLMMNAMIGISDKLTFGALATYEFRSFGLENRDTQILTGDARFDYWFFDFLSAAINYRVQNQRSDGNLAANSPFLEEFTRHQLFFNVGLRY